MSETSNPPPSWPPQKLIRTLMQASRPQDVPQGNILFVRSKMGRVWHYAAIPERLWSDVQGMIARLNAATPAELKGAQWGYFFPEYSDAARSYLYVWAVECERVFGIWDSEDYIFSLLPPAPGTVCINCLQGTPFVGCPGPDY